jgi:hypothetical protein
MCVVRSLSISQTLTGIKRIVGGLRKNMENREDTANVSEDFKIGIEQGRKEERERIIDVIKNYVADRENEKFMKEILLKSIGEKQK